MLIKSYILVGVLRDTKFFHNDHLTPKLSSKTVPVITSSVVGLRDTKFSHKGQLTSKLNSMMVPVLPSSVGVLRDTPLRKT